MDNSLSSNRSHIITLIIIIVGIVIMLVGAKLPHKEIWGIDFSNFLSNLGAYVAVVVCFQWVYDHKSKQQLISEVTQATIKNANVASSGISDCVVDTKNINFDELLSDGQEIIIGVKYSPRFIEDYNSAIENRVKKGLPTTILLVSPDGSAVAFLSQIKEEAAHILPNIHKICHKIEKINSVFGTSKKTRKVDIRFHDTILKYSFIWCESGVWILAYRNSIGDSAVPGLFIKKNSPLFDFYTSDIMALRKESKSKEI